jgi:predicted SprT family Zn-dependent metalloprotease
MHVTQAVKSLVNAELTKCIKVLEARFVGYKFPMPTILYTKRGTTAGTARYAQWEINLNAGLLMDPKHQVEMIEQTAPHELAHLVTFKVYPDTMERGPVRHTRNGMKRGKREVHGPRFMSVMRVMGKDETRCHSMDVSAVRVIKSNSRQDEWKCSRCNHVLLLTPKSSARLRTNPDALWHKGCRGARLVEAGAAPKPALNTTASIAANLHNPVFAPVDLARAALALRHSVPVPTGGSKLDICKALYVRNRNESRGMIIQMFVNAGCTPAGAATYYATAKKAYMNAAD